MVCISLIVGYIGLHVKTTYDKSCAPNFCVGSDLTFNPSLRSNVVLDTYNDLYLTYYWLHLIIWHTGLGCQDNLRETMYPNFCGGVRFEL